jgi:hypothetical protein
MLLPLLTLASCIQQQEESKFNGFVVADYNLCLYSIGLIVVCERIDQCGEQLPLLSASDSKDLILLQKE